jgi:hypothetical protein
MGMDPLIEHRERVRQIAHDLDIDLIVVVDLGRDEVDVHDAMFHIGVPETGVILDHVVADRDDQIRGIERATGVVARLQPDRLEAALVVHVDTALRHERRDHADAGRLDELPQRLSTPARQRPPVAKVLGPASQNTPPIRSAEWGLLPSTLGKIPQPMVQSFVLTRRSRYRLCHASPLAVRCAPLTAACGAACHWWHTPCELN